MADILGVGVIGCGNISSAYFRLAPLFNGIEMRACADLNMAAARAQAAEFNLKAQSVDDLLGNPDLDIVVNLTIPEAHFPISKRILEAGNHAYSEKPLALSVAEGRELEALAAANGLMVGCAPDTFLGGAHQQARAHIDSGAIGTITSGTAVVMGHGMEHWHPNPDFFFKAGAGPVLDIGPYYVANLINLIGPVSRVAALASSASETRTILSEPRKGEVIPVETPTNIHALLEFEQGATVTMLTSWDVWAHQHSNMELYGTQGSIYVPDPNFFGGNVVAGGNNFTEPAELPAWDHPFGIPNQENHGVPMANYRTSGLAAMADAILTGRDNRCSLERTLHGLDVMTSILKSGETGSFVQLSTTCTRPEALSPEAARALMK